MRDKQKNKKSKIKEGIKRMREKSRAEEIRQHCKPINYSNIVISKRTYRRKKRIDWENE